MRILALADTQLGAGKSLAEDRLADQEAVLDQVADLAHELDVDVVLHLGDVFETRHPGEEERMVFKRWLSKIAGRSGLARSTGRLWPRVFVVAGNHDLRNASLASAVDLYDRCEFVRIPTVLDLGGCSLACLPWAPIHNLVAGRESSERAGAFEQAAEALVAIARDLRSQCPAGKPALLAAHWAISGASLPSGLPVDDLGEVVVPLEALNGFDLTVAGHIHEAGPFGEPFPRKFYAGSPYPCSFGEADGLHAAWIVDTDALSSVRCEPLSSRRLATIDCDFTSGEYRRELLARLGPETASLAVGTRYVDAASAETIHPSEFEQVDETSRIVAAIAEHLPLTDATVRLRYTASEEQHRRVDIPAIRRLLAEAGAHKLYSVEPTILRENRARAQGVDESLEPAAALDAWCVAQQVTDMQRQGLQGLLARWSA